MIKKEEISHKVSIAGQVKDKCTGNGISGATIKIVKSPNKSSKIINNLKPVKAAADGYFCLTDLPPGDYQLEASLPSAGTRYGVIKSAIIKVNNSSQSIDLQLPPTILQGKIFHIVKKEEGLQEELICMAKVSIKGSYESTFSEGERPSSTEGELSPSTPDNSKCNYRLKGIEASDKKQKVICSKIGYKCVEVEQKIEVGEENKLNFKLEPLKK